MVALKQRYADELSYKKDIDRKNLLEFLSVDLNKNQIVEHEVFCNFSSFKNSSFSKFIGYCSEQIINKDEGKKFQELFSISNMMKAYNSGDRNLSFECKIQSAETKKFLWLNIYCHFAIEPQTENLFAFFYTYDISDKKFSNTIIQQLSTVEYEFLNIIDIEFEQAETQYKKSNIVPDVPNLGKIKPYDTTVKTIIEMYIKDVASEQEIENLYSKLKLSTIIKELQIQEKYAISFPVRELDGSIHRKKWQYMYLDEDKQQIIHSQSDVTDVYEEEIRQKEMLKNALIYKLRIFIAEI